PKIEGDQDMKEFCTVIDRLDMCGLFTRTLLRELKELGYRRAGVTETGETVFETARFTKFLNEIAKKEAGEDVPLTFLGEYIRIAIILVAKKETEALGGVGVFIRRIKERIKRSTNVIYIFARGTNIKFAKEVSRITREIPELVEIHKGEEFSVKLVGRTVQCYCNIFYNRKML
ncbi:unnamed protein product, partial [marine sediment metagenome]